jgi:hypothetical protein
MSWVLTAYDPKLHAGHARTSQGTVSAFEGLPDDCANMVAVQVLCSLLS